MNNPHLYVFTISHYCEKAKWALDYLGIEYQLTALIPGSHLTVAKKLGLRRGSVPFMNVDGAVIQGSAEIIDWASSHSTNGSDLGAADAASKAIEQRLDQILGVHLRRYYYSEAIIEHPQTVKPIFAAEVSLLEKLKLSLIWPKMTKIMADRMDLGAPQGAASRELVQQELDWLDGLIAEGRQYLVGNQFSRADLTAASLLAPLVMPPEHPQLKLLKLPPRLTEEIKIWQSRSVWDWALNMYRLHRGQPL